MSLDKSGEAAAPTGSAIAGPATTIVVGVRPVVPGPAQVALRIAAAVDDLIVEEVLDVIGDVDRNRLLRCYCGDESRGSLPSDAVSTNTRLRTA